MLLEERKRRRKEAFLQQRDYHKIIGFEWWDAYMVSRLLNQQQRIRAAAFAPGGRSIASARARP
jgi:hypothetical protein